MSCEAIFAYSSTCYLYLFVWRIFQGTSLDQISQRRQAARWCLSPCSMIGAACPLRICLGRPSDYLLDTFHCALGVWGSCPNLSELDSPPCLSGITWIWLTTEVSCADLGQAPRFFPGLFPPAITSSHEANDGKWHAQPIYSCYKIIKNGNYHEASNFAGGLLSYWLCRRCCSKKWLDQWTKGSREGAFFQEGWNPSSYKQFQTFQTVVQFSETVESKSTFKSLLCNCSNGLILPSFQTTRVQIISSFCFAFFFVFRDFRMGKYVHVAFFLFFYSMIR